MIQMTDIRSVGYNNNNNSPNMIHANIYEHTQEICISLVPALESFEDSMEV